MPPLRFTRSVACVRGERWPRSTACTGRRSGYAHAGGRKDLVQETYLKAFRAADHSSRGQSEAWLFTDSHNTAVIRARDRARDTCPIDSEISSIGPPTAAAGRAVLGAAETPESLLMRDTRSPRLPAAIDALPETFRQASVTNFEEFSSPKLPRCCRFRSAPSVAHLAPAASVVRPVSPLRPVNV